MVHQTNNNNNSNNNNNNNDNNNNDNDNDNDNNNNDLLDGASLYIACRVFPEHHQRTVEGDANILRQSKYKKA